MPPRHAVSNILAPCLLQSWVSCLWHAALTNCLGGGCRQHSSAQVVEAPLVFLGDLGHSAQATQVLINETNSIQAVMLSQSRVT